MIRVNGLEPVPSGFDLTQHAKTAARDAVNSLTDPEEDLLPVVLSYGPRGLGIMGGAMPADNAGRDAMANLIVARLAIDQAEEAVMICMAYLTVLDKVDGHVKCNRQETVVLMHCDNDSQSAWTAKVTRHDNRPPDVSIWEDISGGTDSKDASVYAGGRFLEALSEGLAFAKSSAALPEMQELLDAAHREDRVDDLVALFLATQELLKTEEGSDDNNNGVR